MSPRPGLNRLLGYGATLAAAKRPAERHAVEADVKQPSGQRQDAPHNGRLAGGRLPRAQPDGKETRSRSRAKDPTLGAVEKSTER